MAFARLKRELFGSAVMASALMGFAATMAAAPPRDPKLNIPVWLQVDPRAKRKKDPLRPKRGPTPSSNYLRSRRRFIEATFQRTFGRPLSGREFDRVRRGVTCYASVAILLYQRCSYRMSLEEWGRVQQDLPCQAGKLLAQLQAALATPTEEGR